MTKIIDLLEVINFDGVDNAIYFSKELFIEGGLLIAQFTGNEKENEIWFDVKKIINPPYLKTGYTMYILTKHIK